MVEETVKVQKSNRELHWFWKLTTKWWFFPILYLSLVLTFSVITSIKSFTSGINSMLRNTLGTFLYTLILMPGGLVYFLQKLIDPTNFTDVAISLSLIFHPFAILSIILIYYFRYKKKIILNWLILILLLLIILSFSGCVLAGLTHFDFTPGGL